MHETGSEGFGSSHWGELVPFDVQYKEEGKRMNWKRTARWSSLILPFLLLAIWPGVAAADDGHRPVPPGPRVPPEPRVPPAPSLFALDCENLDPGKSCIYETTENARFRGGAAVRRVSTASAQGKVAAGSPICHPEDATKPACDITVVATDNIGASGVGPIEGTFAIVVNEPGTADLPEIVVLEGRLDGVVDISMAASGLGSIAGRWQAKGVGGGTFTGTLRFPFPFGSGYGYVDALAGPPYFVRVVRPNEMVLGFPALLFEIEFE